MIEKKLDEQGINVGGQIVYVSSDPGLESKELYEPIWVRGKIATEEKISVFDSL